MPKSLLILIFLFKLLPGFAQLSSGGDDNKHIEIKSYKILADRGYSIERVRTDTTLNFIEDSLRPLQATRYWLKIEAINRSNYAQSCILTVFPNIDNTLLYFDEDAKEWTVQRAGISVAKDKKITKGRMHVVLQGHTSTTLYGLVNLGKGHSFSGVIKPRIKIKKERVILQSDHFLTTAWIVSLVVLLVLFLNNLHIYYGFRDRPVLYFLVAQLGGMMYITADRSFFRVLFSAPPFSLQVMPDGSAFYYSINEVFMHLSVIMILYGFVQMTRYYLQTKKQLPKLDALLRYALSGYLVFTAVVALVNISGFYVDRYTLLYDNILVLMVMALLLTTSIIAYRRKLPSAAAYLFAHVLPLLVLMSIALYHVLISFDTHGNLLLPDLAVVFQALCFSAAIVSRIKTLRETLLTKEVEAFKLALEISQGEFRHRELALENEQIQAAFRETEFRRKLAELETKQLSGDILQQQSTNKNLQEKLEANQRELASTTLYMEQKNAMLAELKRQIQELNKLSPDNKYKELSGIKDILQSNLHLDEDWTRFKLHFEQVHPHFFGELQAKYPTLTKNEMRLLSYFHLNLTTKEIAALLNIDPASVRTAKTRLSKKMNSANKKMPLTQPGNHTNELPGGQ